MWLTPEEQYQLDKLSPSLRINLLREHNACEREQHQIAMSYLTIPTSLARISEISGISEPIVEQTIGRMCASLTIPFSEIVEHINSFFVIKRSLEEEQKEKNTNAKE